MAYDPIQEIEKLKQAQKQQVMSQLNQAKQAALSNLNSEKSQIQPQFYNAKNQVSTNSQLQAKNFAEYMAGRGTAGTMAQAQLMRNAGLQNQIGNIQQQENQAYTDIDRRLTDTNNQYESNLANQYANIDANANQQIIAARQRLDELARQEAEAQRQREFQAQQAALSRKASGTSNSAQTKAMQNTAWTNFYDAMDRGTAKNWLAENRSDLVNVLGNDVYSKMYKYFADNYGSYIGNARKNDPVDGYKLVRGGRMLME